jgi:predicted nuclease with TOPRIM domain
MTDRDALRERLDNLETVIGDADELTVETIWSHEEPDGDPDVIIQSGVVMFREDAEREEREILGPVETPSSRDTVRVRPEGRPPYFGPARDGDGRDDS